MPRMITADRARLEYEVRPAASRSTGTFVFQHGMGGDRAQPLGYFSEHPAIDVVSMDARGHGASTDLVGPDPISFDAFADDVVALLDHLAVDSAVVGGISLGAAVALNLAVRHPDRVSGLVLCRPAWLDRPQDILNVGAYARIAELLDERDVDDALEELLRDSNYRSVQHHSAAASGSLRHQVVRSRAAANADMLRHLPVSAPVAGPRAWQEITVPTLVIGHRDDPLHPWHIAERTSQLIPGAELVRVPSKDEDPTAFASQIERAIGEFLDRLTRGVQ